MILLSRLALFFLLLISPFFSVAHGYWLELEGNHKVNEVVRVKLFYGEYPTGERMSGTPLDKMKEIKIYLQQPDGSKQEIVMKQANDYWEGSFTPALTGNYEITGVNDTRSVQDWTKHNLGIVRPIQYLKMSYVIGKEPSTQAASLPLDVDLKRTGEGAYQITVLNNGQTIPLQKLFVSGFGSDGENLVTDSKGEAKFTLRKPGFYVLSIDFIDKKPGIFQGKKYETVRHRLDYSISY